MTGSRPGKAADPAGTGFRDLIDAELGPTPPAPADRMEWVLRAALSNGPPVVTGLPRRGYLALAVTLISTGLIAGLLLTARSPAGGRPGRDAGDAGPVAVTGSPRPAREPSTRPDPDASVRARRSVRPSPARSTPAPAPTVTASRHARSTPRHTPPTPAPTRHVPPTGRPTRQVPRPSATATGVPPSTPAPTPTPTAPVTIEPPTPPQPTTAPPG